MKKFTILFQSLLLLIITLFCAELKAQNIVITDDNAYTPQSSAMLDVKSLNKGFLVPRLTTAQMNGIASKATGLLVFNTTLNGFCYYDGAYWKQLTFGTIPAGASMTTALFAVKNAAGDTVFAVYPEGVRINVGDGLSKGSGNKGGFAVGGFGTGKSVPVNFMQLTPQNYFIGHESGLNTTGTENFFAGYKAGYTNTTGASNVFIGPYSGHKNLGGQSNVFIGSSSGYSNIGGFNNVFIGDNAGNKNESGVWNVYLGNSAGYSITDGQSNVFIGNQVNQYGTTGAQNVLIGYSAGYSLSNGYNVMIGAMSGLFSQSNSQSTFVGTHSGYNTKSGSNNTFLGYQAGFSDTTASGNTYIGSVAGKFNTGSDNTFVGFFSGNANLNGNDNVFLGYQAGYNETGSGKLIISNYNSDETSSLVHGDFYYHWIRFNNSVAINAAYNSSYKLYVNGDVYTTGSYQPSDKRFKTNIKPFSSEIEKVKQLQPVTYDWNDDYLAEHPDENRSQMGLIAQDLELLFPDLVKTDEKGFKAISYDKLTVILIQGMKEQQVLIENQKKLIDDLIKRVQILENNSNK